MFKTHPRVIVYRPSELDNTDTSDRRKVGVSDAGRPKGERGKRNRLDLYPMFPVTVYVGYDGCGPGRGVERDTGLPEERVDEYRGTISRKFKG